MSCFIAVIGETDSVCFGENTLLFFYVHVFALTNTQKGSATIFTPLALQFKVRF